MSSPDHFSRQPLRREDLPAELTPETLRDLSFTVLRQFADHRNGVLDAQEQAQFDAALRKVMRGTKTRVDEAVRRAPRERPSPLDPTLSRSYDRAQQRLVEQARRARERFPELALEHPSGAAEGAGPTGAPTASPPDGSTIAAVPALTPSTDDASPSTLEQEVEQTSDTLALLEKIASLQQQQLEHQESQLLTETRSVFFAFLVSVAVIVAGIAPLVEAEPHERLLIVLWTGGVTAVAGLVYALVRRVQRTR